MTTFKITNPQDKEWNGKRFVEATLQTINANGEPEGEKYQISFWNGEISLDGGLYRSEIAGELSKNDKGYWKLSTPKQVAGGNFRAQQSEKLIEKTQEGIFKAQDNKDYSIRTSSSMNKAIEIAIAEYGNPNNLYTMEESILKWREWIWKHWLDVDNFPPF